ncbi:hypothetical protein P3342_013555 [Pyrenophora teres f. teres]|uniref:Nop14 multi-domain protein n=1 Tax=Pyrenophora teres f. teres TaxID=97479 RepID=A0A6S6WH74_9PLEO|nr:hypothetical protein PTNB85_10227 [Pyrenophora teres f. teres]KAE8823165.1 hypothetical protein HRS9139_09574 [Pyrenophora teres f. teres]KAE8854340.1 hypothetical protein PTNB29_09696 [Pyrenophora teres f. teres]KAK1908235.1 hypothetical protein P3342_013555 [Pyrenophora teres f. teres]CAE7220510.1 Nop14 multi-domain protein [Pyrenophora teres f. teres]
MRLRLTVQRNSLPAANVLWNVPETNSTQAYTITRLLEDVNLIIPLEAEHWGLEHYVVEVAGFECLHFMPVINALKEDDHVSIRPLMTAEVRARTLTGRHQISDGGQHLVDGVPFGRPYLRQPNRPAVRIPPRKRRRLEDGETDGATEAIGLLTESGEVSEEDEVMPPLHGHSVSRSKAKEPQKAARSVQFAQPEMDASDDSDEDDDDFAPGGANEEEAASEEDSNDDTDSDSEAKSDTTSRASESSGSDSSSDSDSDDSDSDSDSDAGSPPDVLSSKDGNKAEAPTIQPTKHTPPGQGLKATQFRNSRRTRTNRLRHLKASGELPEHATLSDLQDYETRKQGQHEEEPIQTEPFSISQGKRKRLDEDESVADDATELERRKRELMAKLGESPDTTAPADTPAEPSTPVIEGAGEEPLAKKQTPQRRLRPDTGAIGRILARQAAPLVRKSKAKAVEEPPEPEGASGPDFWKSRINLSAFECWEEDYELSAPPFPFQQHWDPASKLMREKAAKKKHKKRGHVSHETVISKVDKKEDENDVKIVLNYDDTPTINPSSENNDAAIEDQLRNDVATAAQADLPPLPEDMQTLPDLSSSDVKVGAIIACKFFTVNPVTITPEISNYKTATVEHEGDSGPGAGTIQLKIAARDLPKKEMKFDSKGNRIYNAADALLMAEDDEEGLWEGVFGELLEAKLLKAA